MKDRFVHLLFSTLCKYFLWRWGHMGTFARNTSLLNELAFQKATTAVSLHRLNSLEFVDTGSVWHKILVTARPLCQTLCAAFENIWVTCRRQTLTAGCGIERAAHARHSLGLVWLGYATSHYSVNGGIFSRWHKVVVKLDAYAEKICSGVYKFGKSGRHRRLSIFLYTSMSICGKVKTTRNEDT